MFRFDAVFLNNSLHAWVAAAGVFAATLVALLAARALVVRRLEAAAKRTETQIDDLAVELLKRTRVYFILAVSFIAALQVLEVPERFREAAHWLSLLALILQVGVWGNALIAYWLRDWAERRGQDRSSTTTIAAFGALARFVLWLILALVALQNFGVNVTTLVTGLGITGVAVALAVQNILGDLFAALSIVVDKPFVVGDSIAVDALVGTVEKIGLKTTRVRSISGEMVIFANADLLKSRVRNYAPMLERRVALPLGVTFDTPAATLARIPQMMSEIVTAVPGTRFDRSHFVRIGESALEFETIYYVLSPDYLAYVDAAQAINLAVISRFADQHIEFAFPTRTVVVQGSGSAASSAVAAAGAGGPAPRREPSA